MPFADWSERLAPKPAKTSGPLGPRVGVVDGALPGSNAVERLSELFPGAQFTLLSSDWDGASSDMPDILIVSIAAADVDAACNWLRDLPKGTRVIVLLHDADVATTRRLTREGGAADVLPAPVTDPALASALDRLLAARVVTASSGQTGRVVAVLKAGGGVGATSIAVQVGALLARRGAGSVCIADLDLQSGTAAAYLDIPNAITVIDCVKAGAALAETPFATALASHASGLRLLAAPADVAPLEAVTAVDIEALLDGLRRDTALTILDLPGAWTAWTHHALRRADRIVIVTHLSVPHMQLLGRQLRMLADQHLDAVPVTLVCNAVSADQMASLSVKAAERALGKSFDVVLPEDTRVMIAAMNQGVEISAIRRGTKLEKALTELSRFVAADALSAATVRKGR